MGSFVKRPQDAREFRNIVAFERVNKYCSNHLDVICFREGSICCCLGTRCSAQEVAKDLSLGL
jgi:hypothetical protein